MIRSQNKATHQQADGQVYLPFEKVLVAKVADMNASNKVYFPIDKGLLLMSAIVKCNVTVSGGTPAVTVGDSAAADSFVAAAATIETAGNIVAATGAPKYYSNPNYIVVTFNAGALAGEIEIRALFSGKES